MGISSTWINSNGNFRTWIQYNPALPNVLWNALNVCKWDVSMQRCLGKGISSSMNILVMDIFQQWTFSRDNFLSVIFCQNPGLISKISSLVNNIHSTKKAHYQIQTLNWIWFELSSIPVPGSTWQRLHSKLLLTQRENCASFCFSFVCFFNSFVFGNA